ncbi:MAG: hypothetical protein GY746_10985 [Gammaproteobacteria bacterium]|nr:hypothetical protein [Gammaproteobacteria bacterium]
MGWADIRDKYVKPALGGAILSDEAGDVLGGITGETAADAALQAANIQAQAQREQLEYLKEINALPQEYKEAALTQLGGAYGIGGEEGAGADFTAGFEASPYYQQYLQSQGAGEEAIMRRAQATGGLRSGSTQGALAREAIAGRERALGGYMGGLSGIAGTPTYGSQIGQSMADIGQTQAYGVTGAAQARQQGMQNVFGLGLSTLGLFI